MIREGFNNSSPGKSLIMMDEEEVISFSRKVVGN